MKTFLVAILFLFLTGAAVPQVTKPEEIIKTATATISVVREKVDRSLSGDVLVFGTVIKVYDEVGHTKVFLLRRKGAYNCNRGEFVIKEASAFDKEGNLLPLVNIRTDVILTPEIDSVKKEFNFMCKGEGSSLPKD